MLGASSWRCYTHDSIYEYFLSTSFEALVSVNDSAPLYPAPCLIERIKEDLTSFKLYNPEALWHVNDQVLRAWLLLDEPLSRSELAERIAQHHEGAQQQDCLDLIDDLIAKGIFAKQSTENDYIASALRVVIHSDFTYERQRNLVLALLSTLSHTIVVMAPNEISSDQDVDINIYIEPQVEVVPEGASILVCESHEHHDIDAYQMVVSERSATLIYSQSRLSQKWVMLPEKLEPAKLFDRKAIVDEYGAGFDPGRLLLRAARLLGFDSTGGHVQQPKQFKGQREHKQQTKHKKPPFLSIGMATYDDYDGVYFSLTALALYHPEVMAQCEIVVLDNNPGSQISDSLIKLTNTFANLRYEPYGDRQGTAVRDKLFDLARGEWVLCMDSHVMFASGSLAKLIDYLQSTANDNQLLQGPLIDDAGNVSASHFTPEWRDGFYGRWALDTRAKEIDAPAFEIDMQGLGSFVANRKFWPGFNNRFRGFGGEEGYIHQKYRNLGGKCLCLPFLRWAHRFERPTGPPYSVNWQDRIHNYLRGFNEVGLDVVAAKQHFRDLNLKHLVEVEEKALEAEAESPFNIFAAIACINLNHRKDRWEAITERFKNLKIQNRVQRWSAMHTPENHHIGCALSHRRIIEYAHQNNLESVLVFEDDAVFLSGADTLLKMALRDFSEPWQLLYLGGVYQRELFDTSCDRPKIVAMPDGEYLTCTHALAYHQSVYEALLNDLPDNEEEMAEWVKRHTAIDQYLRKFSQRWVAVPDLAQQRQMLWYIKALSNYNYF